MDKIKTPRIETPHQLLVHLVCIDDKHWPRCKKNGDYSERDAEKEALITSRDALLRTKERHEAAITMREELQRTADGTNLEYWVDSLGDALSDAIIGTDLEVDNDWAEMGVPPPAPLSELEARR